MRLKSAGVVVLAISLSLTVTSCSAAQPHVAASAKPALTCHKYASLSDGARKTAAWNTSIKKEVSFDSTSATSLDELGALDKACADSPAGAFIEDVAANTVQTYPDCADYLALSADVQQSWAEAYFTLRAYPDAPRDDQRALALAVSCRRADPGSAIDSASRDVILYIVNHGGVSGQNDVAAYLQGDSSTLPAPAALADSWTDSQGYSYSLKLQATTPVVTADVANALPGKVDISAALSMTGTLTNTTAGKNAPMPSVVAQPVWTSTAPTCTGAYHSDAFASNNAGVATSFCAISGDPGLVTPIAGGTQIAAGSSVDVRVLVSNKITYPQVSQAQALASLASPTAWALARNEGQGLLYGCLMMSGGYYVSTSSAPTGCSAK